MADNSTSPNAVALGFEQTLWAAADKLRGNLWGRLEPFRSKGGQPALALQM